MRNRFNYSGLRGISFVALLGDNLERSQSFAFFINTTAGSVKAVIKRGSASDFIRLYFCLDVYPSVVGFF